MYLYAVKNFKKEESRELLLRALQRYDAGRSYVVCEGAHGKPYAAENGEAISDIHFSVSHTGKLWLCAVDSCPLGLDIESSSRRRSEQIAKRFFAPQEKAFLEQNGMKEFLTLWVRKEAYIKWKGTGLSEGLQTFSTVELDEGSGALRLKEKAEGCRMQDMQELIKDCGLSASQIGELKELTGALCSEEPLFLEKIVWLPARQAKDEAAAYLQTRERCSFEVRKTLEQKGYSQCEIAEAMDFLEEYRYLDDERYCRLYIQMARQKGRGFLRISRELQDKGFSSDFIRRCDESCGEETEDSEDGLSSERVSEEDLAFLQAQRILRGRDTGAEPLTEKEKAKIARRLAYLGYSGSVVYSVLDRLRQTQE